MEFSPGSRKPSLQPESDHPFTVQGEISAHAENGNNEATQALASFALASANDEYIPSIGDNLLIHPAMVHFRSSFGVVLKSAWHEATETPWTDTTIAVGAVAVGGITQVFDRMRIIIQKMPPEAIDLMTRWNFNSRSSVAAGAMIAGAFAMWNFLVGEVANTCLERFPQTTRTFTEVFPRVTNAVRLVVPSEIVEKNRLYSEDSDHVQEEVATDVENKISSRQRLVNKAGASLEAIKNKARSSLEGIKTYLEKDNKAELALRSIKTSLKRGSSGALVGSTIYVGLSAIDEVPRRKRARINLQTTRDASLFIFGFSTIVAELVRQAAINSSPETAKTIVSWAGGRANWNWATVAVIAATIHSNYKKRKEVDQNEQEFQELLSRVTD